MLLGRRSADLIALERDASTIHRGNPVGVRDSKLGAAGEPVWCSSAAFDTFLHAVKSGDFDRR